MQEEGGKGEERVKEEKKATTTTTAADEDDTEDGGKEAKLAVTWAPCTNVIIISHVAYSIYQNGHTHTRAHTSHACAHTHMQTPWKRARGNCPSANAR